MEGSYRNKYTLPNVCSCYYCCKTFEKTQIKNWIDEEGMTALCPYCGIDSVVPFKYRNQLLKLKKRYFEIPKYDYDYV